MDIINLLTHGHHLDRITQRDETFQILMENVDSSEDQPMLSYYGLYKCEVCGKLVIGFDKADHEREKHSGKSAGWKKVR